MQIWNEFLAQQEQELGAETVDKWLRPLKLVHFDACNLYLEAQDSFQALWFEEQIRPKVVSELMNKNGRKIKVHLTVAQEAPASNRNLKEKKKAEGQQQPYQLFFDELNEQNSIETLVPFEGNALAYQLFTKLADGVELGSFNPIFLCGASGVGKSHFLQGAAHSLRQKGLKVIYTRAETFTEHVVSAIRAGAMQLFRSRYRNVDALIIDDVQVFSRKSATQEELFHTFNALHVSGKQLIFAADCSPGELRYVEPRLVSRFEWGIVLPLEPPSPSVLHQILSSKAQKMDFPVETAVISFLVETFKSSPARAIRAFEALLLRAHLQATFFSKTHPLPLTTAQTYLADLISEEKGSEMTSARIIDAVANHYGIKAADIMGKSQKKECSLPRQIAMYLCRRELALPYVRIGEEFERDHSTVMTSVRRVEQQLKQKQSEQASAINAIVKSL
ncbi:MAG: chromosomal replication initiator protein DnaA [Verrucomicrobia bacterium]|nr:chromosomal replication initiator protein DnaA [Verrucomicrobiota bacterium]